MKVFLFPGQGAQLRGMGGDLFAKYPEITEAAGNIMGYDMSLLCLRDPERLLNQTQYTQPALFLVNVLTYLDRIERESRPDCVLGHSLGEYAALFAAGAYSFETGMRLVKKRGELMSNVKNGTMAAVLGLNIDQTTNILCTHFNTLDIANYNSAEQIVISGPRDDINRAEKVFVAEGARLYLPLNVSGAFHSRYMNDVATEFSAYLADFAFLPLQIPVIANTTATDYTGSNIADILIQQLTNPVKWYDSVSGLIHLGCRDFSEIGPGEVLTKIQQFIEQRPAPDRTTNTISHDQKQHSTIVIEPEQLGAFAFRKTYNVKYAYVAGAMVHGIASRELVVKMGRAGMLSYFGTGGLKKNEIESAIIDIQQQLKNEEPYGFNLLNGSRERDMVDLFIKYKVKCIEAAAYMDISEELVRIRLTGLKRNDDGTIQLPVCIMAKISRPEVSAAFLSPPPERLIRKLLTENVITAEEAALGRSIPMADDICVEADSGGHTDHGVSFALVPTIIRQRDEYMKKYGYLRVVRVGAAGGIGTPEAAAAAFVLGADFILTGSVNQCTVEAGMSDVVKDILQRINVQDTTYAPAGDMFEIGAKAQVLKRGVLFPARANWLFDLYQYYASLEEINETVKQELQERVFKRSFEEVYKDVEAHYSWSGRENTIHTPKQKMACIFKWYFGHTLRQTIKGVEEFRTDFQVQTGPAMGAFNQWVKGTHLESWHNRHVDDIAVRIMKDAADILTFRINSYLYE
ncbi:ACP S-malonyltransferase [Chitinophaga sp. Mgbs1]|uniref:[acyl-carrier-protein] S-malonyltransferase n=1 Tax=Chitinophaga solisilvae TaxID=1233460 RepID=A0A3S1BLE2_9BACT|nr:ACP S-malonyltransferase [Chitinophaga solisilvae]